MVKLIYGNLKVIGQEKENIRKEVLQKKRECFLIPRRTFFPGGASQFRATDTDRIKISP